jgi:hypothetical protein
MDAPSELAEVRAGVNGVGEHAYGTGSLTGPGIDDGHVGHGEDPDDALRRLIVLGRPLQFLAGPDEQLAVDVLWRP